MNLLLKKKEKIEINIFFEKKRIIRELEIFFMFFFMFFII